MAIHRSGLRTILTLAFLTFAFQHGYIEPARAATNLPVTSTVKIIAADAEDINDPETWTEVQGGSGFVVDATQQYILTNAHVVVEDQTKSFFSTYIVCTIGNETQAASCDYVARALYADVESDLAILKIVGNVPGKPVKTFSQPALDLTASRLPDVAETITVMGFPGLGGDTITITQGVVSGFANDAEGTPAYLKTDSKLIQGTSGGLVVDGQGKFVGVPTFVFVIDGREEIGMVIAAEQVKQWLESLDYAELLGASVPQLYVETPTLITGFTVEKTGSSSVRLTWDKAVSSLGIDHYVVLYDTKPLDAEASDTFKSVNTSSAETTYEIKNLDPSQTYYFSVVGENTEGTQTNYMPKPLAVNLAGEAPLFSDFPLIHPNQYAVKYLKKNGIISGYPDGTFRPQNTIKRAELLKIVVLGKGIDADPALYRDCFKDVKDEWFAPYICYAKEKGWIAGYGDGNFRPGQDVNLVESLKIIENSYDLPSKLAKVDANLPPAVQNQWFSPYLNLAASWQILPSENVKILNPSELVTRAKTAEHLYRTILLEPYRQHLSVTPWKDGAGKALDLAALSGFIDGASFEYVDPDLEESPNIKTTLTKGCAQSVLPCYRTATFHDDVFRSGAELLVTKNRITQVKEESAKPDGTKNLIEFREPSTLLATSNTVQYIKFKTFQEMVFDSVKLKLFDGINAVIFDGTEKIETAFGSKDAVKVRQIMRFEGAMTVNGMTMPITFYAETHAHYVEGIGAVQTSTSVKVETEDGKIYENPVQNLKLVKFEIPAA